MERTELIDSSIRIILDNQAPSGAYIASPAFPPYAYCWLRDGSFIAYGLLVSGAAEAPGSAAAFLRWVSRVVLSRTSRIQRAVELSAQGCFEPSAGLPTRFHLDGRDVDDDWPNFQIDGYGAWIWCLAQYAGRTGNTGLLRELAPAVALCARYLEALWRLPGFDCWEEHGDRVHPATLACVYGGLRAASSILARQPSGAAPELTEVASSASRCADEVARFVRSAVAPDGTIPKHVGADTVDASLLWLALPFGLYGIREPRYRATAQRIQRELVRDGVKRYARDTYYGGGSWVLLGAWLGWYHALEGRMEEAEAMASWIEGQADSSGGLPEQVAATLIDPSFLPVWQARWGPSARPLLWSHAMYLVLVSSLTNAPDGAPSDW